MYRITTDPVHSSLACEMSVDTYTAADAFSISESDAHLVSLLRG